MDPNQPMSPMSPGTGGGMPSPSGGAPMAGPPMAGPPAAGVPMNSPAPGGQTTGAPPGASHPSSSPSDLYAQITAEDEEVVVIPQKKTTPLISSMAVLMKATFWVDEFKRSNERLFVFLSALWGIVVSVLYLSGIITLCLAIFSSLRLPIYLEKFFSDRGIQYDKLEMADYSFSRINVSNLRDKDNTYNVPSVQVYSTFADFLQKRIRVIEANGLQINLSAKAKEKIVGLDVLMGLLKTLSKPENVGLDLAVNTIRIDNAILNLQGQEKVVPISFSLSGTYKDNNQISIPVYISEDFLRMNAKLDITGPEEARQITLEQVSSATESTLTLPNRPTEVLKKMEIFVQMQGEKIQTIKMEAQLEHASILKTIQLDLQDNGQNAFDGNMLFTMGNTTSSVLMTDLTINFQGLTLTADGKLITNNPLQIDLRKLMYGSATVEGLNTILTGQLSCNVIEASCEYRLKENANIRMDSFAFNWDELSIRFPNSPSLTVLPTAQKTMQLQLNSPYLQFDNLPLTNIKWMGYFNSQTTDMLASVGSVNLSLVLAQKLTDSHFKINIQDISLVSSDLSMNQAKLVVDDYFNDTAKTHFSADSLKINSPLLRQTISLSLTHIGEITDIEAQVYDTPLRIHAQGTFNPFKSTFAGWFNIPPVDLDNIPFEISELSSLLPKNITRASGQFTAFSKDFKVNGMSNVSGDLYVGLKDISFEWDKNMFSGLNGVIGFKSLTPLVTGNNQNLFIQRIQSFIPISNLMIQFTINNQSIRLSHLSGQIAGQDVMMSSTLIPLKKSSTTLSLRTASNFDLSYLNSYIDLPGATLESGKGSFNIPIYVSEYGIEFDTLTFRMMDAVWRQDSMQTDVLGLFDQGNTGYKARSGQVILNNQNQLQVALDGWLLPGDQKNSFGPKNIQLSSPLFNESLLNPIPTNIQRLQNKLFRIED